ncbi:MAG TPA: hypothetical protein PKY29_08550 [Ferruginibacter sp.]|nr:hypothetical protein [Ferruginibacter sp.]HRO18586.1 hypothetical protein [Ferruginibacter sp.]HRQ21351.1 hypothetical protein [Ferruginibacter sp.]
MRDSKISFLLVISFVLIFASFLALGILGYTFYRKVDKAMVMQNTPQPADRIRDSLLAVYSHTIQQLEKKLGATYTSADSLENSLSLKLDEYYRTKDELIALISNPTSDTDFELAKQKIDELQTRLAALRRTNANITEENQKLYTVLDEIRKQSLTVSNTRNVPTATPTSTPVVVSNNTRVSGPVTETEPSTETTRPVSYTSRAVLQEEPDTRALTPSKPTPTVKRYFQTSDMSIEKVDSRNDVETMELIGSFAVKNISNETAKGDIMIVVTQPNGKVLQKSGWESGTFYSEHGKKIYSCKLRVENESGEAKKLTFSLIGDKSLSGTYTFQIYHNGILIGNTTKRV